jgi:uncharacterized protein
LEEFEHVPERTCIVTRVAKSDAELLRFALSPEGVVVPDLKRKLPGRGVWVSKEKSVLAEAIKRHLFAKGFGKEAKAGPELLELVTRLLRAEMLSAISLSRKAGLATQGFMKVEEAATKGKVAVMLHAAGCGTDGCEKLNRKCGANVAIFDLFEQSELDLAFGRENVVHASLTFGGQTQKLLDLMRGFAQYENLKIKGLE